MLLLRSTPTPNSFPESLGSFLPSSLILPSRLPEEIIIWERQLGKGPGAGAALAHALPHPCVPKTAGSGIGGIRLVLQGSPLPTPCSPALSVVSMRETPEPGPGGNRDKQRETKKEFRGAVRVLGTGSDQISPGFRVSRLFPQAHNTVGAQAMAEITLSYPHARPRTQHLESSSQVRCQGIMTPRTYLNPQPKLQGHLKAEVEASERSSPQGLGSGRGRGKHFRVTRKGVGWER